MTNIRNYIVIERDKLKAIGGEVTDTSGLITAGGKIIIAKNADEAEEVYVCENGGSINDLVSFIAWVDDQ